MFQGRFEGFLIGVFSILFLYFITHYFTRRGEKYNLYFAVGCLISIIRTLAADAYLEDGLLKYYSLIRRIDYFSFMWGPMFYILLAESLFPKISHIKIVYIFAGANTLLSIFVLVTPVEIFSSLYIYDYLIIAELLYATYLYTAAVIKKRKFAIAMVAANLIFILGVAHDVLYESSIIPWDFGEVNTYTYFMYLYISSVVLAQKFAMIDKKSMESQVNFLHAQIQPHFLYNTINTIIAYSRTDPQQTRRLLVELSTYLRGKFKTQKENYTSIKDEIALIKSYLNIEQVRFKKRLEIEYDIDEECDTLIPCLILQPIVENAVKHGLTPKKEGGKLTISIKRENNNIIAKIKDNGVGMDMKRLPKILQGSESGAGIGLSNTNERLERYYNTHIHAQSEIGKGTEVTVTIPIVKGSKND